MITKITKAEEPSLFTTDNAVLDFSDERSHEEYRRGSNFFVRSLVVLKEKHAKFFPEIKDFSVYLGTWETNLYVWDSEYGVESSSVTELTRVEKKEEQVTVTKWVPVASIASIV